MFQGGEHEATVFVAPDGGCSCRHGGTGFGDRGCGDDDDASSDATAAAGATTGAAATTTAGGTESTAGSATTEGAATTAGATTTAGERDRRRERPGFSRSQRTTFAYANPGGVNQRDPHRVVNAIDAIFMRQVYDRVLVFDQTPTSVELAPQLATSWEIADDGMSITFELRDDVTFQDGTKFDATAFKANMDRAMGPD